MTAETSVAVIIPTYNHARFLVDAIESVLSQSVPASEILVVDDGSDDRPDTVVANYANVRIISQPNRGLSAARNRGLAETNARNLIFLDADDRLLPNAIRHGLECMERHPEAAFVYGAHRLVNITLRSSKNIPVRAITGDPFAAFLRRNMIAMHGTVLYRRNPIQKAGGFREALCAAEDYDMYLRLAMEHSVGSHPGLCAEYYIHGANMSQRPDFMLRAILGVLRDHRPEAARRGLLPEYKAGVRRWKRNYAVTWAATAKDKPMSSLRAGAALARLAPGTLARKLLRPRSGVDD